MSDVDSTSHFPAVIILPCNSPCPVDESVTPPTEQQGMIFRAGGKTGCEMTKENWTKPCALLLQVYVTYPSRHGKGSSAQLHSLGVSLESEATLCVNTRLEPEKKILENVSGGGEMELELCEMFLSMSQENKWYLVTHKGRSLNFPFLELQMQYFSFFFSLDYSSCPDPMWILAQNHLKSLGWSLTFKNCSFWSQDQLPHVISSTSQARCSQVNFFNQSL